MVEKAQILKQVVRHKGVYNYSDVYAFCYEWFKGEDYILEENKYTEKMSDRGKEVIIEWRAWKKISDYFKNVIEIKWHILGQTDVEAESEGRKIKTNKGDLKITFTAQLERDYEERWEVNPVYKFFRGIYDRYIVKTTMDEYENRLREKTEEVVEELKGFLVLEGKQVT